LAIDFKNYIKKFNEHKHKVTSKSDYRSNSSNVLDQNARFNVREAYKTARTNIIFSLAGEPGSKKIIFTSSEPGEGKSTTSLNTAITFAQTGAKVILIDCDLRKPRLHRYMEVERKNGLSDLLIGLIDISTAIHHHESLNLDFIPAGQIPPNPVELLSSNAMEGLLNYLGDRYDYIFIDTPPVTTVSDACSMAQFVDGYIIIIRHNYTIHEFLEKTLQNLEFAEAKVLGFIMNDVKPMIGIGYSKYGNYGGYKSRYRYNYKYKYSYNYKYGYDYGYHYGYEYSDSTYGDNVEMLDDDTLPMDNVDIEALNEEETAETAVAEASEKKLKKKK